MSQRTIRFATPEDAETLAELAERTFRDAFAADNNPEDLEDYVGKTYGPLQQRRELEDPKQLALLVERDGAAIAFAQLRLEPEQIEISRFYVERTHHGGGIAHELMQRVIEIARERGAKTLWLGVWEHNPRAIRFYEKCGFVDVGSHPFLIGTDLQTDRRMSMTL
ncbi:MAG TPA: GNAT family N-acetyltransferase [Thermoanaerobaculia bacterium]|jgi:ribosomal protein S18 acetylase RimI-like enzyme